MGSFGAAGALLYLALRGVNLDRVAQDLRSANYWWVVPVVAVTLLSHWLRAWRWTMLLAEIKDPSPRRSRHRPTRRVTLVGAFGAIMVGYLANYAAPRLGEVVRATNVSTRYGQRFGSVFGTVFTERVLDMATFGIALLTLPLVFAGRLDVIISLLVTPLMDWLGSISPLIPVGAFALMAGVGYGVYRWLRSGHGARIASALGSFRDGLTTISRTRRWPAIVSSTIAMWLCYGLMAFLPFVMIGLQDVYDVSLVDAWGIMLLGSIGVILPSPGGFGSYHYITIQSLVLLFAFPQEAAASYAILTHTGQLLIYVVTGVIVILGMGLSFTPVRDEEVGRE
jgi:glycosyltransferase 2 family protein